jgi:ligand-binding sensor domain-containing protein
MKIEVLLLFIAAFICLVLPGCPGKSGSRLPAAAPNVSATKPAPAGRWSNFTNGDEVNGLAVRGKEVWWATTGGVVKLDPEDGSYTKFTVADGLPDNMIFSVTQDQKNNLWFGTPSGVVCYDNSTWHTYTTEDGLAANYNSLIAVDGENNVWCGGTEVLPITSSAVPSETGVSCYNGQKWQVYNRQSGLISNRVYSMCVDTKGMLWLGTDKGIAGYDGSNWQTVSLGNERLFNRMSALASDSQGCLWLYTGNTLRVYDGKTWRTVKPEAEQLPLPFEPMLASARAYSPVIFFDREGNIWINEFDASHVANPVLASEGYQGLSRYDGRTWQTIKGTPGNSVKAIAADSQGILWFGTDQGVYSYNGTEWRSYATGDMGGFNSYNSCAAEDQSGNLWFGTWGNGLLRYDGQHWQSFTTDDGLSGNSIFCLLVDSQNYLYAGTRDGLSRYDGKKWHTFEDGLYKPVHNGNMLAVSPGGEIWAAFGPTVYRCDGEGWQPQYPLGKINTAEAIAFDPQGRLWVASISGAACYDGEDWQSYPLDSLFPSIISLTFDNSARPFIATVWGIFTLDGNSWQRLKLSDGSLEAHVARFYIDRQGNKWVATDKGITFYDGKAWQVFKANEGLAGSRVGFMFEDSRGNYWFGVEGSINRYVPQ